jgi:hypothetical protein
MHSTATESHRFVDTDPDAMVMSLQDAIVDGFCTGNRQVGRYTYVWIVLSEEPERRTRA